MSAEKLPFHELKKQAAEIASANGFVVKNTFKKKDLIKIIETGKNPDEAKEKLESEKRVAPRLVPEKEKPLALIPDEAMPDLNDMKQRGMSWVVDEVNCGITFKRDMEVYTSLDAPVRDILSAARQSFRQGSPVEIGHTKPLW